MTLDNSSIVNVYGKMIHAPMDFSNSNQSRIYSIEQIEREVDGYESLRYEIAAEIHVIEQYYSIQLIGTTWIYALLV